MKIIDIHSHFFNLKYLPVAGIIVRYSQGKVSHRIAAGIEWLLLKNTRSGFETEANMERMNLNRTQRKAYLLFEEEAINTEMDAVFNFSPGETAAAISQLATAADLLEENPLSKALDEFGEEAGFEIVALTADRSFANAEEARMFGLFDRLKRLLEWIMEKVKALRNYLKWFLFMTNSEEDLYTYLRDRDEKPVEHFLHLMMDVDAFFNDPVGSQGYASYFDFVKEQIPNMQKLNAKYQGKITGFVAFNPARGNCMEIVKDAIENRGFKGIKFYPPLGYKAYGDEHYKDRIEALMSYCVAKDIPLFTHCNNQGFEAHPEKTASGHSGYNSNPVFWESVLKDTRFSGLRLCLAHGGGVEGWFTHNNEDDRTDPDTIMAGDISDDSIQQENWNKSYAAMVYKLCVKHPNVYCDAAYLDEMINSNGSFREEARKNFKKRLLKLFAAQPGFGKKIIYGSDWHMLFQEAKNNVYLSNYTTFFEDTELIPFRDDFFYNNACRYLNFNPVA